MKKLILTLLTFYRKYLSLNNFGIKVCRYTPSCSEYTFQAVEKYGVIKGLLKGALRILKCNPFFKGGYDPVQ